MKLPTAAEAGRQYDTLYQRSPFEDSPRFYHWVTGLLAASPGESVLDIGCGGGGALRAVAERGASPWGIDVSGEALGRARDRAPNACLVRGDGARLPYPDRCFRLILNLGNLEHFTDLEGGIREMRRVLTDDGRAWVLLPNLFYSGAIWRAIRKGYGPDHHQPIDRFATRQEWHDLLNAGGLEVLRCIPYHKGKWWKRLLPANLAWHFLYETRRGTVATQSALVPLGRVRPTDGTP